MVGCSAYRCKSRTEKKELGITFHRFPRKDPKRLSLWIKKMHRADWVPQNNSKHFEHNSFYKIGEQTRLLDDALPKLFPELPKYLQDKPNRKRPTKFHQRDMVPESKVIGNPSSNQHQSSKTNSVHLLLNDADTCDNGLSDKEVIVTETPSSTKAHSESVRICRLCKKDLTDAKNIFEDYLEDNVPIHIAMTVCLYPMQVSINDPLPKYACGNCLNTLYSFVKFRTFTLRNDKIQRVQFASLVSKEENVGLKRKMDTKKHLTKKRKTEHISDQEKNNVGIINRDVNLGNIKCMPDELLEALKIYRKSKLGDQGKEQTSLSNENVNPNEQVEVFIIQVDNEKSPMAPKSHIITSVQDLHKGSNKNKHERLTSSRTAISEEDCEQLGQKSDIKVDVPNDFLTTYANVSFCMADGYLMEHKILKENLRYLKCALAKCPAIGTQEVLMPGVYKNQLVTIKNHNHERPTEIEIKKQKLISVVRKKLQNAKGLSIKSIYDEVCRIVPATAHLVPLKYLLEEICNL